MKADERVERDATSEEEKAQLRAAVASTACDLAHTLNCLTAVPKLAAVARRPDGNAMSSEAALPVTRGEAYNVAWRTELGGQGPSSPIASGETIIVTAQVGRGVRPGNRPTRGLEGDFPEERSIGGRVEADVVFVVEAFRRREGQRLWQYGMPAEPDGSVSIPDCRETAYRAQRTNKAASREEARTCLALLPQRVSLGCGKLHN